MITVIIFAILASLLILWFLGNLVWMTRKWYYCPRCDQYWNEFGETSEFDPGRVNPKPALCPSCVNYLSDRPAAPNYMHESALVPGEREALTQSQAQPTTNPAQPFKVDAGAI